MNKGKKYIIKYSGRSVEMSKANSSVLIYRIPFTISCVMKKYNYIGNEIRTIIKVYWNIGERYAADI